MSTTTQRYPQMRQFGPRLHMLASVKEGLYHPMLPTFRRMDMDTAVHRLPEEHSRTTTPLHQGTKRSRASCKICGIALKVHFLFFFQGILGRLLSHCTGLPSDRCQAAWVEMLQWLSGNLAGLHSRNEHTFGFLFVCFFSVENNRNRTSDPSWRVQAHWIGVRINSWDATVAKVCRLNPSSM